MSDEIARWKQALEGLPADASLQARIEAVVVCGRVSGEHDPERVPYYCCEKVDALLAMLEKSP